MHRALDVLGRLWLSRCLGSVDFLQNHEILLFLHDLRAISFDETNGCAVLSVLLVILLLLEGVMGVFQWRTVQPDRGLQHTQVDAGIGIGAWGEDLGTLNHGQPENAFPSRFRSRS